MKTLVIVGTGIGTDTITQEGLVALDEAEVWFGAERLLEHFAEQGKGKTRHPYYKLEDIRESIAPGEDWTALKAGNGKSWACVHASATLYAGFPHLYFPANPAFCDNFVRKMRDL
jgi:hypothetical protein